MIPLQTDADTLVTPLLYVAAGLCYGGVAYFSKDRSQETFRPYQLVKTLVVYGIAGLIAFAGGSELNEEAIIGATAIAAPIADTLLNSLLAPASGGSPTKGRR